VTTTTVYVIKADLDQIRHLTTARVKSEILESARVLFRAEGRTITLEHEMGQRFSLRSMNDQPTSGTQGYFIAEMPLRHLLIWIRRKMHQRLWR